MKPIPFGSYVMLERLAIGGMAEVWLAKKKSGPDMDRLIALKRILPGLAEDAEFLSMFMDEARIAGQLAHANIAQIFDVGSIGASSFIALEYVPGVDVRQLWDRVRGKGGFPLSIACFITARICEGLDYAHRRKDNKGRPMGIVHRDVSPQNVLVSFDGDVKIIDFGIARAAGRAVKTQTGILKGKFAYMAPEHARGMALDHRADIFAIGVILHELLTGERLFRAESDFSLLEKVRNAEVSSPRIARPDVPPELEKIVMRALAFRQEDRYPWASAMAADLDRFLVSTRRTVEREDLSRFVLDNFPDRVKEEHRRQDEAHAFVTGGSPDQVDQASRAVVRDASDESTAIHDPESSDATRDAAGFEEDIPTAHTPMVRDHAASEQVDPGTQDMRGSHKREPSAAYLAAVVGETLGGDGGTDPSRDEAPPPAAAPKKKPVRLEEEHLDNELVPRAGRRNNPSRPERPPSSSQMARLEELPTADAPARRPEGASSSSPELQPRGRLPQSMADVAGPGSAPEEVSRRQVQHLTSRANSGELSIHGSATAPLAVPPPKAMGGLLAGVAAAGVLVGALCVLGLQATPLLGKGTLVVLTGDEDAHISVDDKPMPGGSFAVQTVGAGVHKVTIALKELQADIQQVEVPAGGFATVKHQKRNARGALQIISSPPGAAVFLNEKRQPGATPMTVEDLDPGVLYKVTLRHPEALQDESEARTEPGQTLRVVRRLKQTRARYSVEAVPEDAAIMVDGAFKGRGRTVARLLKQGERMTVKVLRPGCVAQTLEPTGEGYEVDERVELKCAKMDASITVKTPAGARLRIDDVDTGLELPVENYKLPAGRHAFEVVGKKVRSWQETLSAGHKTLHAD